MSERSQLTVVAVLGIWVTAVLGCMTMALAVVGAVDDDMLSCAVGSSSSVVDGAGAAQLIVGIGALVPVLIALALAPRDRRKVLVGLAVAVAVGQALLFALVTADCRESAAALPLSMPDVGRTA